MADSIKPGTAPPSALSQPASAGKPAQQQGQQAERRVGDEPKTQARGQDVQDGGGAGDEMRLRHEQRTTVPGAPNVDARLDNRAGPSRPTLETYPAKPQQVPGPDVMGQVAHTARTLGELEDAGDRKGMFSPGPHGLSSVSLRDTDEPTFGTEGLSAAEAAKGSPTAG